MATGEEGLQVVAVTQQSTMHCSELLQKKAYNAVLLGDAIECVIGLGMEQRLICDIAHAGRN